MNFLYTFLLVLLVGHSTSVMANPISDAERQKATDEFIAILKGTHYFDFVDSRVHGMPENNAEHPFWWGTIWTGIDVQKINGRVIYTHNENGTDNAGIFTSPYLESACFAYLLTGDPKLQHLSRRLMRGLSSWILSSAQGVNDTPKILSRAFFPASVYSLDGGRDLFINYDANRPGVNSGPSDYVRIPNNPYFGDIWVKNKRSIDDIGHMIRAIGHVQACRDVFDEEGRKDLDQMNNLYATWANEVERNDFEIPTYDLNGKIFFSKERSGSYYKTYHLGDYNTYKILGSDPNCPGKLAVRFLHANNPGSLGCGKGISLLEKLGVKYIKNDAIEILRSNHVAAVAMAELRSQTEVAEKLRRGLRKRIDRDYKVALNNKLSRKFNVQDIPTFFVHANNVGVGLTPEEIRFVYERLHTAYVGMLDPIHYNTFHLFDSSVPDGKYSYDAPDVGLFYRALGPMIGSCTSRYLKPAGVPLFDCERLKNALMEN